MFSIGEVYISVTWSFGSPCIHGSPAKELKLPSLNAGLICFFKALGVGNTPDLLLTLWSIL